MKRFMTYAMGLMISGFGSSVLGGEASTSANATTGLSGRSGTTAASANYTGADGGVGLSRTHTQSGDVNLARGLAFGVDKDGMDLSFSHAIAPRTGPSYAGTFNLSIGSDGDVSGSYGGVVSRGGAVRSVEAGGLTRSAPGVTVAQATARGDASPGGTVVARTNSYNRPSAHVYKVTRARPIARTWR